MAGRRQVENLDDEGAVDERAPAVGGWKRLVTETDEIDEIAERDARKVLEKVRFVLNSDAARAEKRTEPQAAKMS